MKTIIAILIAILTATNGKEGSIYPDAGVITDITNNVVTYQTANGNLFSFDGAEDYLVGDIVAVMLYDNATETVTDDIIISVRYAGYVK